MAGRPPSSYAYPKLWKHIEDLDLSPSARAIKILKNQNKFKGLHGTGFSNRLIETKMSPDDPKLLDYSAAHDLHGLVMFYRNERGLPTSNVNNDLVKFSFSVSNLGEYISNRTAGEEGRAEQLATISGLTIETIYEVAKGRLFPQSICHDIVLASNQHPSISVTQHVVGREFTPCSESNILSTVLLKLAA